MGDDDYEALPEHASPRVHMIAGAAAGVLEHTALYPFDVLKTRLQRVNVSADARYTGIMDCASKMYRQEGVSSYFRGMRAVVLGAGPAHALYFSAYEKSKLVFNAKDMPNSGGAAAAVCATLAHDSFMNPVDVVKQRMQVQGSKYRNVSHCIMSIWRTEGIYAFYRSFTTSVMMNIPFHSTYLMLYDKTSYWLNPSKAYSPITHMTAGAIAGAVASGITTPFDVCRTYLNTTIEDPRKYRRSAYHLLAGIAYAGKQVYREAGIAGFSRGWSARMIFTAPAGAISWAVYESFKHFLHRAAHEPTGGRGVPKPSHVPARHLSGVATVHAEESSPEGEQEATPSTYTNPHVCAFQVRS